MCSGTSSCGSATSPSGNSGKSRWTGVDIWRDCRTGHRASVVVGRHAAAGDDRPRPRSLAGLLRAEDEVVEDRRRQARLEQHAVDVLQARGSRGRRTASSPSARSPGRPSPPARGWPSRTSWPAAPRRARATSVEARRARARRARSSGHERVDVDHRSSWWFSAPPSLWPCRSPGRRAARARQAGATRAAARLGTSAMRSPWREGSPAKTTTPPGRSTRRNSANAWSRSGRWCSTAWPSTRSNDSSSNGSASASATRRLDRRGPRRAALPSSASSIPGEMSVQVAWPTTPACSRFSEK